VISHDSSKGNQVNSFITDQLAGRSSRSNKWSNKTLRGLTGFEIVSQKAKIVDGKITEFRVTIDATFILES